VQVHGDYSEDVGVKLERPADEPIAEAPAETAAWTWREFFLVVLPFFDFLPVLHNCLF